MNPDPHPTKHHRAASTARHAPHTISAVTAGTGLFAGASIRALSGPTSAGQQTGRKVCGAVLAGLVVSLLAEALVRIFTQWQSPALPEYKEEAS